VGFLFQVVARCSAPMLNTMQTKRKKKMPLCGKKRGGDFCGFAARKKENKIKNNEIGQGRLGAGGG